MTVSELLGVDCDIDFYDESKGHLSHYPTGYTHFKARWKKKMDENGKEYLISELERFKELM